VATEPGSIPEYVFAMYQCMFAMITVALISGALAERVKFSAYCIFVLLWTTLCTIPCPLVWMVDGWLFKKGPLTLPAGQSSTFLPVSRPGVTDVPRQTAWFPARTDGAHSLPLTLIGVGLLWFGWFGFNAGSAIVGVNCSDARVALQASPLHHTIAPAAGGLAWMIAEWIHAGKPRPRLRFGRGGRPRRITPAAGFVQPGSAIIIGIGAGIVCYLGSS